jgi:protein TonB
MTLLAGAEPSNNRQQIVYGLLAIMGAISLHGILASVFLWQPESHLAESSPAAPLLFEVSRVAAPSAPSAALPVGLEQQKASPPPSVQSKNKTTQADAEELLEALPEIKSDVLLQTTEKRTKKTEPQENVDESVTEDVVEKQQEDSAGEASGENSVAESRKPLTQKAKKSEVASAPQIGALSEAETEAKLTWQSLLQAHLERRKRYPRRAQMLGQQGVPWVSFSVDRQGNVLNVELYRGSGYEALDKEVVALVYRAEPLPLPPEEITGELLTMAVPVAFFRH